MCFREAQDSLRLRALESFLFSQLNTSRACTCASQAGSFCCRAFGPAAVQCKRRPNCICARSVSPVARFASERVDWVFSKTATATESAGRGPGVGSCERRKRPIHLSSSSAPLGTNAYCDSQNVNPRCAAGLPRRACRTAYTRDTNYVPPRATDHPRGVGRAVPRPQTSPLLRDRHQLWS